MGFRLPKGDGKGLRDAARDFAMNPPPRTLNGFLSYAHHDRDTDRLLVDALISTLEKRVRSKIVNDYFRLWSDNNLRGGQSWGAEIERALDRTDVLIVLVTPRWLTSDFCRREYEYFEGVEHRKQLHDNVLPILAQQLESELPYVTDVQRNIWSRLRERQNTVVDATNFRRAGRAQRDNIISHIADEIVPIIAPRRNATSTSGLGQPVGLPHILTQSVNSQSQGDYNLRAHNYNEVDFLRTNEIYLESEKRDGSRRILGQLDFNDSMYIETARADARIEFGIQRAFLIIRAESPGGLSASPRVTRKAANGNVYSVNLKSDAHAVSLSIDPHEGHRSLGELALPPSPGENYLCHIASTSDQATPEGLSVELRISLGVEGLYIADEIRGGLSAQKQQQIKAITRVALGKWGAKVVKGQICRELKVEWMAADDE
jgi:hypothetical protein